MKLRCYQEDLYSDIYSAWSVGHQNICAVGPCGMGKTVLFGTILKNESGYRFAIAHRQELVCQMALTIAKMGVEHCIVSTPALLKYIIQLQIQAYGRHFYNPRAKCIVTGVITLINRASKLPVDRASLWIQDECHHTLKDNVWGKAVSLFPSECRGLGVTATPNRADGKGIGRHNDGVFDLMIEGPTMRYLINQGYLTDYRIFGPYSDIDMSKVTVSATTGDYSKPKLTTAVRESKIVGDVVKSYIDIAPGKLGVVFVPDVQTGNNMSDVFNTSGVPSKCVHAKTPDTDRQKYISALSRGDLKILVNVDIFGEGFDLPAIEVVSMARPTESLPLYIQQFGRGLRVMTGKDRAIIIDHVRNVERHGLPDSPRLWSIERRDKKTSKKDKDLIPIRTCQQCLAVYESWNKNCPYCGWYPKPAKDGVSIEQVEGVLTEMNPEVLSVMRGEVDRIDVPSSVIGDKLRKAGAAPIVIASAMKQHRVRQETQGALRDAIAIWAGYQKAARQSDDVTMRRFYKTFGVDILSAQTLGKRDAEELTIKLKEAIK